MRLIGLAVALTLSLTLAPLSAEAQSTNTPHLSLVHNLPPPPEAQRRLYGNELGMDRQLR